MKNQKSNPINFDDVKKLTKYHIKLANMTGGAKSEEKRKVYNYKLNDYSRRLSNSGVDVAAVRQIIQSGGDPLDQLRRLHVDARAAIAGIQANGVAGVPDITAVEAQMGELKARAEELKAAHTAALAKYTDLAGKYGKYVVSAQKEAITTLTNAQEKQRQGVAVQPPGPLDRILNMNPPAVADPLPVDDDAVKLIILDTHIEELQRILAAAAADVDQLKRIERANMQQSADTWYDQAPAGAQPLDAFGDALRARIQAQALVQAQALMALANDILGMAP
jgi:hypothetical protein